MSNNSPLVYLEKSGQAIALSRILQMVREVSWKKVYIVYEDSVQQVYPKSIRLTLRRDLCGRHLAKITCQLVEVGYDEELVSDLSFEAIHATAEAAFDELASLRREELRLSCITHNLQA